MVQIVFDIGGTNMRVGLAEGDRVVNIQKQETPQDQRAGLEQLFDMIESVADGEKIASVFGGFPGVVCLAGSVLRSGNLPNWQGLGLQETLALRFDTPVYVYNDAALAGYGEVAYGPPHERYGGAVGYLRIGTGVGGTRFVNGEIDRMCHGLEPGEQIIEADKCRTLGRIISGAALQKRFCMAPHGLSRSHYDKLTPYLAIGVFNCIMLWGPQTIILGGSLMNEDNGYRLKDVIDLVTAFEPPYMPGIRLGTLGDEAGLYGAAALERRFSEIAQSEQFY